MSKVVVVNREAQARRGRRLEYFTIIWNSIEGLVAILAGVFAGSISLVGFGIDSLIEVTSGGALLWRMSVDGDERQRERIEAISLRVVGICFLALAAYVGFEAVFNLVRRETPRHSIPGIALAIVSLIVMPILASAKRNVSARLGSAAMAADATQTQFCMYLSAILLVGLFLNAAFGFWWADPAAALLMAPIMAREGLRALQGKTCCTECS